MTTLPDCATEARATAFRRFALPRNAALALLLVAVFLASLGLGPYPAPLGHIIRILFSLCLPESWRPTADWSAVEQTVVQVIRLPRILLAALAGAGLGLCGASLQGMMRNPLVGPDLLGISSGAVCGGMIAILFDWPDWALVASAFSGGFVALLAAWALARAARGAGLLPIILAGVVVSAFFTALHGLIQYTADAESKLPALVYWLIGSFAAANAHKVAILAPPVLCAGALLLLLRWRINLLSLDEMDAQALGERTGALRWLVLALVALIVAAQVSVSGIVGWVGLIVPHVARMIVGADHRRLLPASAMTGAIFLIAADDIGRTLSAQELPIGILTALVGAPVFALLFWRNQARNWTGDRA